MPVANIKWGDPQINVSSVNVRHHAELEAEYIGKPKCPHCDGVDLRKKDKFRRKLRHESVGSRITWLYLTLRKYHCRTCGRYFRERVPGLLPYRRSTEAFRKEIFWQHRNGISQKDLSYGRKIGSATIERWFHDLLDRKEREFSGRTCPLVLGIDEHRFNKKCGFATTFCDLKNHRIFEIALGRSEASLDQALRAMKGRERVQVVCIDLSSGYRAIVRKYFPNARIVADRFHVVRLMQHHVLEAWKQLDPVGRKNRGLLSLIRRHPEKLRPDQVIKLDEYFKEHPAVGALYDVKTQLHDLLRLKSQNHQECKLLAPELVNWIDHLKESALPNMKTLGNTLEEWMEPIACMWRFTRNNGITEGFHRKMKLIQRRAYGFRNFDNYRLRVITLCG